MKAFMKLSLVLVLIATLVSCAAGHQDFIDLTNKFDVGHEIMFKNSPSKFSRAGEFIRGNYVVAGEGLLNINKNEEGQLVYHVFVQEILPNTRMEKEWIGKCLIYYVVDPETYIVKDWGFDEGGNPLSCRTFT
jgi:hypothetical protein